ncbi:MAG: VOC family protein [Gudongella sp.]|nr:VOC family protein [Gudongella sp.]
MSIGAFSVSLNVKDIKRSKVFYEKLGFKTFGGEIDQNWLIMKNDDCVIGLFQEMFDKNILTFNPGWNADAEELETFKDIRVFQEDLREKGIEFESEVDVESKGPGSFMIVDPDGNLILIDQHV